MENKEERIKETLESASDAFWAEVAKRFPEAKSGDFPPEMLVQLDEIMEKSIRVWLDFNVES
jgi:hypothetical protein